MPGKRLLDGVPARSRRNAAGRSHSRSAKRRANPRQRLALEHLEARRALATLATTDPVVDGVAGGPVVAFAAAASLPVAAATDFLTAPSSGGVAITGYAGSGGDVVIPDTIGGLRVSEIRERAFQSVSGLTSVVVPGTVETLDLFNFDGCPQLTRIVFSEGVRSLGQYTLGRCPNLREVVLPASLEDIDANCFVGTRPHTITFAAANPRFSIVDGVLYKNKFVSVPFPGTPTWGAPEEFVTCMTSATGAVTVPSGVTGIRSNYFSGCTGITSLTIPASVTDISLSNGTGSFAGCTSLVAINVDPANQRYASVDGVLYDKSLATLIRCPPAKSGALAIPSTVTALANTSESLAGCGRLQSVSVPAGLADLGSQASAFRDCVGLASITVAAGHPTYASIDGLLYDKAVTTLVVCPAGRTGTVRIPATVTDAIGALDAASALERVAVAAGHPSFAASDGMLFDKAVAKLLLCPRGRTGTVTLPATATDVSSNVFLGRSAVSAIAVAAGNPTYVGSDGVLYRMELPNSWSIVVCPEGRAGSVTLPAALSRFDAPRFSRCRSLSQINIAANHSWLTSVDGIVYSKDMTNVWRVPAGRTGTVTLPAGVKAIFSDAFSGCVSVTGVSLPSSLQTIRDFAFQGCSALSAMVIPAGVTTIGMNAFAICTSLRSITIPGGVGHVGDYAFFNCTSLESVVVGNGVASLGVSAFYGCESLESVVLPASLTTIEEHAFARCTSLRSVELGSGLRDIGGWAFYFCSSLQTMTLPASVTSVGDEVFAGTAIQTLVFLGNAPTLGNGLLSRYDSVAVYRRGTSGWTDPIAGLKAITTADAPTGLVATGGDRRAKLAWNRPAFDGGDDRVTYRVEFSADGGTTWTAIERSDPTATNAVVTGLSNGRQHRFRVAMVNRAGVGAFAVASATPAVRPSTAVAFAAPGAVAAITEDAAATLSWSAPFVPAGRSIGGYAVEYSADGGWTWLPGPRTVGVATNVLVPGLTNGVAYQFRVAAYGAAGNGGFSKPTPAAVAIPGTAGTSVRLADDGTHSTQFTPDGRLARLTWERSPATGGGFVERLVYRCEAIEQDLVEEVVLERPVASGFRSGDPRPETIARLLFAPDGTPQVLVADQMIGHYRREAAGWKMVGAVVAEGDGGARQATRFVAAVGPSGALHLVAGFFDPPSFNFEHGPLYYGTNLGGSWKTTRIAASVAVDDSIPFNAPVLRQLGLAVDGAEKAHVVYSPEFVTQDFAGFTRDYSELAYASNASGSWTSQIVHRPPDGTGASGFGNTIAIAPDGQPVIAQFFVDNVDTGSHVSAQLIVHQRQANGTWTAETVVSQPDGYVAGDGPKFSGFSPEITFDRASVPHIAFADYAAQHFPDSQYVFAGQLRHAWKEGGRWQVETVVRQADPLNASLPYPSVAAGPGSLVFTGLRWERSSTQAPITLRQVTVATTSLAAIESAGRVTLARSASGLLHANGVPVSNGGVAVSYDAYRNIGWTAVAADSINGVNSLLWRHTSGVLLFWRCDGAWNSTSADAGGAAGSTAYYATESAFGTDVDGDGWVGVPNNRAPTAVALSASSVAENRPAGTVVGTFSTNDPNPVDSFTYTIVQDATLDGTGLFEVVGNQLRTKAAFNFEAKLRYSIRVRSTDQGGLFTGRVLTVSVTDVNEAPTALSLLPATILEGRPIGTVVGTFASTDPDAANTFRYTIIPDTTLDGTAHFQIVGNELRTKTVFNAASKATYSLRVRTTDQGGLSRGRVFTITIGRLA